MMKLNTEKPGLTALFLPHHAALLQRLYEVTVPHLKEGKGSGGLWRWFNEHADKVGLDNRSRASIIFALNDLVDMGFVKWVYATGKGGHQRRYSVAMTKPEFEVHVTDTIANKLLAIFEGDWWRIGP